MSPAVWLIALRESRTMSISVAIDARTISICSGRRLVIVSSLGSSDCTGVEASVLCPAVRGVSVALVTRHHGFPDLSCPT
jgi:hypothetical protein